MQLPEEVNELQQTLGQGGSRLFDVLPVQLANVIKKKIWQRCVDKNGEPFKSFEAFVVHRLPQGLESSIADLEQFCRKKLDVQKLIREQIAPEPKAGGDRKSDQGDNITLKPKKARGTSPNYAIARLKRDRPDLAARVIAGELSPNKAMVEAGFRPPMISVRVDTPENALKPLIKIFGKEKLRDALAT